MLRENLFDVHVTVKGSDGLVFKYVFDDFDGGHVTAKETKYRPANGTEDQVSLGGAREVSNITVKALNNVTLNQWSHWLMSQVGKGVMTVAKQPLDVNGAPWGVADIYNGLLNGVTPSKTSSESDAAAMFELEQSSVTPVA